MNDVLCNNVSRCCLGTEDHCNRSLWFISGFDVQIFVNDIQDIHLMSLILMETFDLNIEDCVVVQYNSGFFFQIFF